MSDLSNRAKQRNWLKMRLKGTLATFGAHNIITQKENVKMAYIYNLILDVLKDFDEESRVLGFKVKNKNELGK